MANPMDVRDADARDVDARDARDADAWDARDVDARDAREANARDAEWWVSDADADAAAATVAAATHGLASAPPLPALARFRNYPGADLFNSRCDWLVNPVNCIGISGVLAGVFAQRFPVMEAAYWHGCKWSLLQLGSPLPYFAATPSDPNVLLFPTMRYPGTASHLPDLRAGLDTLARRAKEWGVTSIAFPMMGCGVGGLDWKDVEREIRRVLGPLDMEVELYGPDTTNAGAVGPRRAVREQIGREQIG